ncbi:MAG: hypothetical protein H0X34_07025 [Chthoniobacterales bacterium]|nr:hypothetical protein [Chthoniobacterales bacterium]
MRVFKGVGDFYCLEVPEAAKADVASLMALRGLTYSTSASRRDCAVLFTPNPYALADIGGAPELAAYKKQIDLSRALDGVGTKKLPPGKELWDYQRAALDYVLARGGGLLGQAPGLGKTITSIAFCNEVEAIRVLVIVPASVRIQWGEQIKRFSTISNVSCSVMLKVKDGIHPTANYQVLSYDAARNPAIMKAIAKSKWDVLILDECLVGETLIHTEIGLLPIRRIVEERMNVRVWSRDPQGCLRLNKIQRWVKSSSLNLVECCANGQTLRSTEGHRIYGKDSIPKNAGALRSGHPVQVLRSDVFETPSQAEACLLQQELHVPVQLEPTGAHGRCSKSRYGPDAFRRMGATQQPTNETSEFRSGISRQTGRQIEVAERNTFSSRARGQRKADTLATNHDARIIGLVARLAFGIRDRYRRYFKKYFGIAYALQSRLGKSAAQNSAGNRRDRAQMAQSEGAGQTEGLDFRLARLDRVSLHQSGSFGPVPVYDIEVERDHNYIANGFLVSNCHKLKNVDSLTSRAILGNTRGEYQHGEHKMPPIASHCKHTLALTGTVLLNRPSECWNLFRYFDHESIDFLTEDAFKERYNKQATMKTIEGKYFKLESTSLESELQNRLRIGFMTRHEKKDVLRYMKPPRYSIVKCEENGAVKGALNVEGMLGLSIDEIQTTKDFEILGHIAEARRLMGLALAPQIIDYATDFLEGSEEKLVIFGWHIDVLSLFEEGLSQFGTVRFDARKSAAQKQKAVDDFISDAHKRVFISNILSGGTGVDGLQTVCSRCFIAEPDWVPAQNEQAVSRLDRIGQKEIVNAEIFVAPGSISEKILVRALEKMNIIHQVLDAKGV